MPMTTSENFLDRLIERLDRIDPSRVQNYVLKLVREKGFLETVFNTIQEGVIVIDHEIRMQFINRSARQLLGMPDEVEGQRLDRYLRDVDWLALMEANPEEWKRVSIQEMEVFYPKPRILSFYIVPHSEQESPMEIPMATIIFRDITETRQNTEEAIESRRVEAITKLAAGVAHEIGNPLNSLNIHLQLLDRSLSRFASKEDAVEARELLDVAHKEVERLDSIVSNFLRAVRPTQPDFMHLDIRQVLAESLRFMRNEIEDRGLEVEASLPDSLPTIRGDSSQLKQAFYNIIKNSIQAMSVGDKLAIICDVTDQFLEIRFTDTGKGISGEHLRHIMEPYYTTRADGTGLGLLVIERIVREHGGEIGIESTEGEGTVFTVRLPLFDRRVRLLEAPRPNENGE
ncbi:MAG: ATP-binding protein [Lentisphaeria bacterium]